jgi:hypothetical protein
MTFCQLLSEKTNCMKVFIHAIAAHIFTVQGNANGMGQRPKVISPH